MTFNKSDVMKNIFALLLILVSISGCQDQWTDRVEIKEGAPVNNLMEELSNQPELSQFVQLLQTTGWDSILTSTKPYTIWAPNNDAVNAISSDILNDPDKLQDLVNNHICILQYDYLTQNKSKRVKTSGGKYINLDFNNKKVNDANLLDPYDIVANNGVLHIIDKALIPKMNIWEYVETTQESPELVAYIKSLTGLIFDQTIATQIGVDPTTGKAIYDTASGLVWDNMFLNRTRDLRNEDTLSTLILFADQDFASEFAKFREYYTYDSKTVSDYERLSDSVTSWKISKDIVFAGSYSSSELPAVLTSTFGVQVPIGSFIINSSFEASNGMVYNVSNYAIEKPEKIPIIIIQGEDSTKYIGRDPFGQKGFTRQIALASGGYDFVLDNHGGNPGTLTFRVPDLCNTQYEVYLKAIDDFNYSYKYPGNDTIKQSLGWVIMDGTENGEPIFPATSFNALNNGSIYILDSSYTTASEVNVRLIEGPYDPLAYKRWEWIQLKGSGKNTPLTLDYIKLVPIFND